MRVLWSVLASGACGAIGATGCHQSSPAQALLDGGVPDGARADAAVPLKIDISVTGCTFDDNDGGAPACSGPAPLHVQFSPVGSPALATFLWRFGDGSPAVTDRAPAHTYALPGRYDVSVTAGDGSGTVSKTRPGLVTTSEIGAGGSCDVDAQCASGLACLCQPGSGCGAAFTRGICTTACSTGFCGSGAVCVAYTLEPTPTDAAPPSTAAGSGPLCLAACTGGTPCPPGFACGNFHAGGNGATGWVQACLPRGAAADFGASCRNAAGLFDNSRCASGFCAPLAANGLCSASCQPPLVCPPGAACARIGTAQVCLAACSQDVPCSTDPRTACRAAVPADGGVDGGLAVISGDVDQTYCAPR